MEEWICRLYGIDPDEPYEPKVHDFRASSKFKHHPDGTMEQYFDSGGYIDPRDTIILDPI